MKQLLQDVSSGEIAIEDVPAPARGARSLLVATRFSVISSGTERAAIELGKGCFEMISARKHRRHELQPETAVQKKSYAARA